MELKAFSRAELLRERERDSSQQAPEPPPFLHATYQSVIQAQGRADPGLACSQQLQDCARSSRGFCSERDLLSLATSRGSGTFKRGVWGVVVPGEGSGSSGAMDTQKPEEHAPHVVMAGSSLHGTLATRAPLAPSPGLASSQHHHLSPWGLHNV